MLDCNRTLTHVSFVLEPETKTNKMQFEKIEKCSWDRVEKIREANKNAQKETATKIRIQLQGRKNVPSIEPGDYMINGEVTAQKFASVGDLLKKYPEHTKVKEVVYNTDCQPYSQHIRITGN